MRRSGRSDGDLLEHGSDDAARTAPRRPEVDEHGLVGLEDLGVEVVVGDFGEGCLPSVSFVAFHHYTK